MNRRSFLQVSGAATSAAPQIDQPPSGPPDRPNVIWLFADQHRAQALSCNGDPNVRTPAHDRLAATGVNFARALSGFPLCCPYRGSLLTGRYPHACVPGHEFALPDGQPTIAKPFQDAGYTTAWFGKWHLSGWKEANGRGAFHIVPVEKRGGFDTWAGYENNNSQWDCWIHGGQGKDAFHYRLPGYETDELSNMLIRYIRERSDERKAGRSKPFFAALSVQPPHDPYVAPEEYMARFNPAKLELRPNVPQIRGVQETARRDLAGYYAMIENWDANIARIVKTLEETNLYRDTHILVFSDHGDMHGSHGLYRKTNPYEESIRVPFIVSGGQAGYQGWLNGRSNWLLNHVDVAPTTLGLCGIAPPKWMQGQDLSQRRVERKGRTFNEPDSAFLQCVVPTGHGHSWNKPYRGIVTRDGWKYVCFENTSTLMVNLNEDPYEQMNVAHNNIYAAERKKLLARLRQWVSDTGDRFALPEI